MVGTRGLGSEAAKQCVEGRRRRMGRVWPVPLRADPRTPGQVRGRGSREGAERKESREEPGSCGWGAGWACENWTVQGQDEGPCFGPDFEGRGMPPAPGLVQRL